MQSIVIDKPYIPVPPYRGGLWPKLMSRYVPRLLRKKYGVTKIDVVHAERLQASMAAGHGVLIAPNHCRDEDPLVLSQLARAVGSPFFIMASWHLFVGTSAAARWRAFLLRRAGAFSIYREGIDRTAVNTAIEILETAERPLVIFPEGFIARTNDVVNDLLEGTSLIARTAAKRRAKEDGKRVVVHPVALRYKFFGDINAVAGAVLDKIETRLTWRHQQMPLYDRIVKVGGALLALKELEYLGEADNGPVAPRLEKLANAILNPLEETWAENNHEGSVPTRVKRLRSAILPDMTKGELDEAESQRRWKQLADLYLAQQLFHYPPNYLENNPTPERILETVERLEEDLTDKITRHGNIHVTITVGEAIEVTGERTRGVSDPLTDQIHEQLERLLGLKSLA
jgi:1-acyl-sn-glycerol-3-phosphate acyltransferase